MSSNDQFAHIVCMGRAALTLAVLKSCPTSSTVSDRLVNIINVTVCVSRVCFILMYVFAKLVYFWSSKQDRYAEIECHSCRLGGAGGLSFSADGQTLVTAGLGDGSLVCTRLR